MTATAKAAVKTASASAMKASQVWTVGSAPAQVTVTTRDNVFQAVASAVKGTQGKTALKYPLPRTSL